jgi:hypothetical protein
MQEATQHSLRPVDILINRAKLPPAYRLALLGL